MRTDWTCTAKTLADKAIRRWMADRHAPIVARPTLNLI